MKSKVILESTLIPTLLPYPLSPPFTLLLPPQKSPPLSHHNPNLSVPLPSQSVPE